MNNYELDMPMKIVVACIVLHNLLRKNKSNDEIFNGHEQDDMIIDEDDEQST